MREGADVNELHLELVYQALQDPSHLRFRFHALADCVQHVDGLEGMLAQVNKLLIALLQDSRVRGNA